MTAFKKHLLELLAIFLSCFIIYNLNLYNDYKKDLKANNSVLSISREGTRNMLTAADNVPNSFLPYLILKEKTIYFDSIIKTVKSFDAEDTPLPYFLMQTKNGIISVYPLASAILVLPFYVIPFMLKNPNLNYYENVMMLLVMARLIATLLTALSVTIMYTNFKILNKRKWLNILLTIFFALGTAMYPIASRGLWMHTTSILIISILINFVLNNKFNKYNLIITGMLMGILVLIRLTNVTIVIPLCIYLVTKNYKNLNTVIQATLPLIIGALPFAITLLYTNYIFYGSVFSNGYEQRGDIAWNTSYLTSLSGFFISPARGFLFLTPLLLLIFIKIFQFRKIEYLEKIFLTICIVQILVLGKWWAWDGANAFGDRMLLEILPFMMILVLNLIKNIKNKYLILLLILSITYSIYVHTNAVFNKKSRCTKENNWNFECLLP